MIANEKQSFLNELYYIVFLGGTGGNLLSKLLYHLVYCDKKISRLSSNGSAHDDTIFTDRIYNEALMGHNENAVYSFMSPINYHTNTMIEYDHVAPEWSSLFSKFPNCKAIVITVTIKEVPRIIGNLFFKNICGTTSVYNEPWEKIKINHSYLSKYQYPNEVPSELIEKYIKEASSDYKDEFIVDPFKPDSELPKDYNIYTISYNDLIHNPNQVLLKLEHITNREISKQVRNIYDEYLALQENLVKTKMPWISDK